VPDQPADRLPAAPAGADGPTDALTEALTGAARTGRLPTRDQLEACRRAGTEAAVAGRSARTVVAGQLDTAVRVLLDPTRPTGGPPASRVPGTSEAFAGGAAQVRSACHGVLTALAVTLDAALAAHQEAALTAARREDDAWQAFLDDLLNGRGDAVRTAEAAQRFGVLLAGRHVVAVARRARPLPEGDPLLRRVEGALTDRFGRRNVLVAIRDGLLVCVLPSALRGGPGEFAHHLVRLLGAPTDWQIGVGRPRSGPGGVMRSFDEARQALQLADRLGFRAPVLHAADLMVFPVLLRDQEAVADLVDSVLGPLLQARGGPGPMLDTLAALFDQQGNTTAAARRLGISVRAVGYRLDRIKALTGYSPTEPTQRFTLEAAVLGARLMDWPDRRVPRRG